MSADLQKGLDAAKRGDYASALREWKPLAEQGDAGAQFNLGFMYDRGDGVTQNDETAVKWYKLAAKQGLATAQNHLERLQKKNSQLEKDRKPSPTVTANKTPTKKSSLPSCPDSPERFPTYLQ